MKIHLVCNKKSQDKYKHILKLLTNTEDPKEADVIISIGGDGCMLYTIKTYSKYNKPIYGINTGTIGFLMNHSIEQITDTNALKALVKNSQPYIVHPLETSITHDNGKIEKFLSWNEVCILRNNLRALILDVHIDNHSIRCKGDGIMVSTPMGSSAYNYSINRIMLPIDADLMIFATINATNAKNIILPTKYKISTHINTNSQIHDEKDIFNINNAQVDIKYTKDIKCTILFSHDHNEKRIASQIQ